MAGEDARVNVRVCGEDGVVWVDTTVNGLDANCPVHAASIEDAEGTAMQVERLVKSTYRKAYRDGYSACQQSIKSALGLK